MTRELLRKHPLLDTLHSKGSDEMADITATIKILEGIRYALRYDYVRDGIEAVNGLNDAIELLKEHQWILTSERLPECQWGAEVGGILFCLKGTGSVEIGVYGTGGKLRDRYFRRWTDGLEGWDANSVLAWMFAPKPLKEDDTH